MRSVRLFLAVSAATAVLLGLTVAPASAEMAMGTYYAEVQDNNDLTGGGDGYDGGTWYLYPNYGDPPTPDPTVYSGDFDVVDGVWNQWWYNHPYDPSRYKVYEIKLWVEPIIPDPTQFPDPGDPYIGVIVNWATDLWSLEGNPPGQPRLPPIPPLTPEDEQKYVGRTVLETKPVPAGGGWVEFGGRLEEEDASGQLVPVPYNPEWISLDIWGEWFQIPETYTDPDTGVTVPGGRIWHDCVPEPTTVVNLCGLGLMIGLAGVYRWRRKK